MAESGRVAIDCDDAAVEMKKALLEHLHGLGIDVTDLEYARSHIGAMYPEIGYHLACQVRDRIYDRGVLICGTGLGMAIVANKVEGIYAGVCHDVYSAERLAKSNDAQVLTLGQRVIGIEHAKKVVEVWLASRFEGGGSTPKVDQMRRLEHDSFHPGE